MNPLSSPSYEQLAAENARLRKQLAQRQEPASGVQVDLQKETVSLSNLSTQEVDLQRLEVRVPGLKNAVAEGMGVVTSLGADGRLRMPDLGKFQRYPMKVVQLGVRVPQSTLNRVLSQRPIPGLKDLHLEVQDGGRLKLSGYAKKVVTLPFEVEGSLSANGSSRVKFHLERARVGGFLPVPNLVTNFLASLASTQMAQAQVTRDGDDYTVELAGLMPPNVGLSVDRISSAGGVLSVETGNPGKGTVA